MRAIVVMFDTLNRRHLPPYGCDWTHAPNFQRLAERSVTFDTSYVCSMPCMPARREMHTGRPNFLHRSWGPLEPFDDSAFEILKNRGVYTHLVTDHYHYFEDGGLTYHPRYRSWEFNRGQEGDPWIGQVADPENPDVIGRKDLTVNHWRQDLINRQHMRQEHEHFQSKTFRQGVDFMRRNAGEDDWVLQLETFDPHEPFFVHRRYQDLFAEHFADYRAAGGLPFDWPAGGPVTQPPAEIEHLRHQYAALLGMCDARLGDLLEAMDELNMWRDTMLMVCTDHGLLLGERDMLGKMWCPFYEEVARTPCFVWDPRSGKQGERRRSLVQPCLDLPVTLLRAFGQEPTPDMLGKDLAGTIADDTPVREAALFGAHGAQVNVTDGRYVYMRAPADPKENGPLFEYTHMPSRLKAPFPVEELRRAEWAEPFSFTKGCGVMKIPRARRPRGEAIMHNELYDLESDPQQNNPLDAPEIEQRMTSLMIELMRECDAPSEQYDRLGLRRESNAGAS